jgi:hypothetical protein
MTGGRVELAANGGGGVGEDGHARLLALALILN